MGAFGKSLKLLIIYGSGSNQIAVMIKNFFSLMILLFLLCGCTVAPLMQTPYFDQVAIGSSISEVEAIYGQPFEIRQLPNGLQAYVYLQRINLGKSGAEQIEFVFLVNQGVIASKECKSHGISSLQFFY